MRRATQYIFTSFFSSFLAIFFCLGTLYLLIDYSLNIKQFLNSATKLHQALLYFICCYLMRFDFFLILSLLFATLSILITLKKRYELLAFQAGGISLKRLFSPIIATGIGCSLLMLVFYQFLYPSIIKVVDEFQQKTLKKGAIVFTTPQARALQLENGTSILFTHADSQTGALQNTYIIPSLNECWFCKEYNPHSQKGFHVYQIRLGDEGYEIQGDLLESHDFSKSIPYFTPASWSKRYYKGLPLGKIYEKMKNTKRRNIRIAHESNFMYKLSISFLSMLILPLILSYSKTFSRKGNISILFASTFVGFIILYMALVSLKILGEEEFLSTLYSFPFVLGCITLISLRSYVKL